MRFFRCGLISLACGLVAFLIMFVWSTTTMAQTAKWFQVAQLQLKQNDVPAAIETAVRWSKGKNFKPDSRYFSIVAEIAERSTKRDTAAICDKQARCSILEKGK